MLPCSNFKTCLDRSCFVKNDLINSSEERRIKADKNQTNDFKSFYLRYLVVIAIWLALGLATGEVLDSNPGKREIY